MKTLLLIFLSLLPFLGMAQDKWWHIDKNDIGVLVTQGIAGAARGYNQNIQHHHLGQGSQWYDYDVSWKNKYKDYDKGDERPAYFLSKSVLVFTTDAWHCSQMVSITSTLVTIGIVAGDFKTYPKNKRWLVVAKKIALSLIANGTAFLIVYK